MVSNKEKIINKIDPDKALAELCRRSFFKFLQEFWSVVIPETPIYNWHIELLCDEMQYLNSFVEARKPKPYDLIINVPPGSTKSTIISQMYTAWVWTRDPSQRFISSSYSAALSIAQSVKTRDIVLSDKYQRLFPEVKLRIDQRGKTNFSNTKGGQRYTTSTGGTVTGMHAHQLLVDDPVNPTQALSEIERLSANDFVTKTLSSRKVDKDITPMIVVMQRLHVNDVTGELLSRHESRIKHICLPAEISSAVKPAILKEKYVDGLLDPIRLNRQVLADAKSDLGSYDYAGQFEQQPVLLGGNILKEHWFDITTKEEYTKLYNKFYPSIHYFVDTAYTSDSHNDPTGVIAVTYIDGFLYVINANKVRMEFPELSKFLPRWVKQNGYSKRSSVRIEPKASGLSVIQQLRRNTDLNIISITPPKESKELRTLANTPIFEAKRVRLVEGDWNDEFLTEITSFPAYIHDEYVDLINYAVDANIGTSAMKVDTNLILNSFR